MDTTDPDISFDDEGVCSHCHGYDARVASEAYQARRRPGALDDLVARIRREGEGKRYDCVIGVSGGVDSSYLALLTRDLGLRPLAVHLDNGWNSELAVHNIRHLLETLDIDLYTHVLDWEGFRDLQLSFLKASVPDCEIPTDHAILALMFDVAVEQKVGHILLGRSTATEGGGVAAWSQGHGDWGYIKGIHKVFGTRPVGNYPHFGLLRFLRNTILSGVTVTPLLDYVDYHKERAIDDLMKRASWRPYSGKHYESVYTRFYQGYILPFKFGYDKRLTHLSALIWSGQKTREEALSNLKLMRESDYPEALRAQDLAFVAKKFGMSEEAFTDLLGRSPATFGEFPSYQRLVSKFAPVLALYRVLRARS